MFGNHEPHMRSAKSSIVIWLLNAILLIAASIQTLVLVLNFFQVHFALPESIRHAANNALSHYHLSYRADQQYMTANGMICVKDLEIFLDNHNESIIECKQAEFRFSIFRWLFFKLPLRAMVLDDASICVPALYSSTGKKENCLKHIHLNVRLGRKHIHIKHGSIVLDNLKILLKGEIPRRIFSENQSTTDELKDTGLNITQHLFTVANYFEKIQQTLTSFEQPMIGIELMEGPDKILKVYMHMSGMGIDNADWGSVKRWDLSFWLDVSKTIRLSDMAQLELNDWVLPNYHFRASHAMMEFEPTEALAIGKWDVQLLHACKSIDVRLMNVSWNNCDYDYLKTNYNLFDEQTGEGQFVGYKKSDWIDVAFNYNPTDRSGKLKMSARWNPEEICALKSIRAEFEAYEDKISFGHSPYWDADVVIGPNLTLDSAQFNFLCQNLNAFDLDIDYLEGTCHITPDEIKLTPLLIVEEQEEIDVQFFNNFKSNVFKLLAKGRGYPLEFSSWFPEWWKENFSEFHIHEKPFYVDLEANGNWDDTNQTFVYGFIRGEDFSYKDFSAHYASGTLWAINGYLDLSNFHVVAFPGSEGNYRIQWAYRPESKYPYYVHLKGQGNLPESVLSALPKTEELRSIISASTPPWVSIIASVYGDAFPEKSKNIIHVKAQSNAPINIYGHPFDNISLEAMSTATQLTIDPLNFGFARGVGHGNINIAWANPSTEQDKNKLSIDVAINGMHRYKVQHSIPYLSNVGFLLDDRLPSKNNDDWNAIIDHGGLIDCSLKASGNKGDLLSFTGTAQAHLYDAEIGRIRLFGGLSKIIDPLFFNISSFSLREATAHASINHEILHFDDIILDGPSAEVMMSGDFNMSTEQLNFVVELDPFKNVTTPLISQVLMVTKPFTRALKMNLKGTKDNPVWELRHNPIPFP
jgi:hypothetical protein